MDKITMSNFRWNPYALISGNDLEMCFQSHFTENSNILVIMSKGFDVRMNLALRDIKSNSQNANIKCLLIEFNEGDASSSHDYKYLVDENVKELHSLVLDENIISSKIQLWHRDGQSKRRVGDRKAADIIDSIKISDFTDIIVDISALPRGIYFSLIGKLLTVIDAMESGKPNLMVTVAENPSLDRATRDDTPDDVEWSN